jgi:SinI restriction endonuclease
MPLTKSSIEFARNAMLSISPQLSDPFVLIVEYLIENPSAIQKLRKEFNSDTEQYLLKAARAYSQGRALVAPAAPKTIPDEMVKFILGKYFDLPERDLNNAISWHGLAMGAENLIGNLLERYIASELEQNGWAWCAGSLVKSVDFIRRHEDGSWYVLQVKNRDNSENSSSAAIRIGTTIEKWFRTFSKKTETNWENFPVNDGKNNLSEKGLRIFVEKYLNDLKR